MKSPHPKYKIKQDDTITSITERFGVSEDVWKRYHNNMCRLDDVIWDRLPKHLEEIYLLPELWGKVFLLNVKDRTSLISEKKVLLKNDKLFFCPENINNQYGVVIFFSKDKLHYEIKLKCLASTHNMFRLLIDRKQVYINNTKPDGKLYELADRMAKAIYPIIIEVNKFNRKIKTIYNYDEVRFRGLENLKKMKQYFVGEYSEKYMKLHEQRISNCNNLIKHLQKELFFELYFLPLQQSSFQGLHSKVKYEHISDLNITTIYNLDVRINPMYTESGKIIVKVESIEKINSEPYLKVEYRLCPKDHSIFSIRGYIMSFNKKKMNTINFEVYQINTKDKK